MGISNDTGLRPGDQAQRRPFFSLKYKMLVYFGLLFTLSLAAIEFVSVFGAPYTHYEGEYDYLKNEIFRNLNFVADLKKERLMRWLEERKDDSMTLAESAILKSSVKRLRTFIKQTRASGITGEDLWEEVRREEALKSLVQQMNLLIKHYGTYEEIEIVDAISGLVIASTDVHDLGENVFSVYPSVMAQRKAGDISMISFDKMRDSYQLHITQPIESLTTNSGDTNTPAAFLILHIETEDVFEPLLLAGKGLGKTGEVVLVDSDTRIIAPLKYKLPDGSTAIPLRYRIKAKAVLMAAQGKEGITMTEDYRGEPVLAAYRHIIVSPELVWGMVVKIDKSEVFAPLYRQLETVAFTGAIGLIVTLFMAWLLAHRISVPLTALSRAAGKVENGDLNTRAESSGYIETHMLASAFNSMITKIHFRRKELEDLVSKRTSQLQRMNAELTREIAERNQAEEALKKKTGLVNLLQEITGAANETSNVDEAIQVCLDKVCDYTGWEVGHAYVLGFEDTLMPTELWRIDDPRRFKAFIEITRSITFKKGVGLPGRVLESGNPVWLPDVTRDQNFHRAKEAAETGLKAGFAFPVLEGKKTVAVLTFFTTERVEPDESLLKVIENLATQLGRVTERKRTEQELAKYHNHLEEMVDERTNELAVVNKELEAFAYSVSHDLRAPLRGIDGFSKALLEDYADKVDDDGKDYLNRVRAATLKMSQLIDDLLILSRVTRSDMAEEKFDLSAMVHDVTGDLRKEQPDRHVKLTIEEGLVVKGDKRLLRVVLYNLISNAWKFTGELSEASIEFGAVQQDVKTAYFISNAWKFTEKRQQASIELGLTQRDGKTAYFVRDNGVGFDMKYAGKLFGAFQRLHAITEFPGTGVGLATVQRIIRRHGGRVWAEAKVDEGATFYFTL